MAEEKTGWWLTTRANQIGKTFEGVKNMVSYLGLPCKIKVTSPDVERLLQASRDLLDNYEKCPQYPQNITIRHVYLKELREALIEIETDTQ